MSSFSIYTRITIEVYARFPWFTTDFTSEYEELPPFLHKGVVVKKNAAPIPWTVPDNVGLEGLRSVAAIRAATSDSTIYTAHQITVSNNTADKGSSPCLETAPVITEAIPTLVAGVTDTQSISFTILDPELRRYFSSDFTTTNSIVRIYRVGKGKTSSVVSAVWVGYITSITQGRVDTTISARNEMKKLEQKATFGFLDEIPKWRVNDYKVPIISAVMIPYTVQVEQHAPQLVSYYEDWRRDYYLLATGRNVGELESSGANRRKELDITFKPFFGKAQYFMHKNLVNHRLVLNNLDNVGKSDAVTAFVYAQDIFFAATYRGFIYAFNILGEPHNEVIHNLNQNPLWVLNRFVGMYQGLSFALKPVIYGMATDGSDLFLLVRNRNAQDLGRGMLHKIPITVFTENRVTRDPDDYIGVDWRDKTIELGEINAEEFREKPTDEHTFEIGESSVSVKGPSRSTNSFFDSTVHPYFAVNPEQRDIFFAARRDFFGRNNPFLTDINDYVAPAVGYKYTTREDKFYMPDVDNDEDWQLAFFGETLVDEVKRIRDSSTDYYDRYNDRFVVRGFSIYYNQGDSEEQFLWGFEHTVADRNFLFRGPLKLRGSTSAGSGNNEVEFYSLFGIEVWRSFTLNGDRISPLYLRNVSTTHMNRDRHDNIGRQSTWNRQSHWVSFDQSVVTFDGITPVINLFTRIPSNTGSALSASGWQSYVLLGLNRIYNDGPPLYGSITVDYPVALDGPVFWFIDRYENALICCSYHNNNNQVAFNGVSTNYRGIKEGFVEHDLYRIAMPGREDIELVTAESDRYVESVSVVKNSFDSSIKDIAINGNYIYVSGYHKRDYNYEGSNDTLNFVRRYRLPYSNYMEETNDAFSRFRDITAIGNTTLIGLTTGGYICFYDLLAFKNDNELTKTKLDVRLDDWDEFDALVSIAYHQGFFYILAYKEDSGKGVWSIIVYTPIGKRRKYLDFSLFDDPLDPFVSGYRNNYFKHVAGIDIVDKKLYVARSNGSQSYESATKFNPYIAVWDVPEVEEETNVDLLSLIGANIFQGLVATDGHFYLLNSSSNTIMAVNIRSGVYSRDRSFVFSVDPGEAGFGVTSNASASRFYVIVNRLIERNNSYTGYIRVYDRDGIRFTGSDFRLNELSQYTGVGFSNDKLYALNGLTNKLEVWGINGARRASEDLTLPDLPEGHRYDGVSMFGPTSRSPGAAYIVTSDPGSTNERVFAFELDDTSGVASPILNAVIGAQVEAFSSAEIAEQRIYSGIALYTTNNRDYTIYVTELGLSRIQIFAYDTSPGRLTYNTSLSWRIALEDTRDFSGITAGIGLLSAGQQQETTTVNFYMLDAYDNTVKFFSSRTGLTSTIIRLGAGTWTGITTDDAVSVERQRIAKDGYIYIVNNRPSAIARDGLEPVTYRRSVHVYGLDGGFLPNRSFGIDSRGDYQGITVESLGVDLYLLDNLNNRVIVYNIDGRRSFLKDFDLPSGNWTGITTDGLYLYVLDNLRSKIAVYSLTGKRRNAYDRTLTAKDWTGITSDNESLFVVNNTDKKVVRENVAEQFSLFRGNEGKLDPDQAKETGQNALTNYINNTLSPNYVTFAKDTLPRSFIQMESNGRLTFNRGIFILPSEDDNPTVPGETFSPLALNSENFRLALAPAEALVSDGFAAENFGFNRIRFSDGTYSPDITGTYMDFDAFGEPFYITDYWFALHEGGGRVAKNLLRGGDFSRFNVEGTVNTAIAVTVNRLFVLDNADNRVRAYNYDGTRRRDEDLNLGSGDWQRMTVFSDRAATDPVFFIYNKTLGVIDHFDHNGTRLFSNNLKDLPGLPGVDRLDILSMTYHSADTFDGIFCLYDISTDLDALPAGRKANSGRYVMAVYAPLVQDAEPQMVSFSQSAFVGVHMYRSRLGLDRAIGLTASGGFQIYGLITEDADFPQAFYQRRRTYINKGGNLYDGIGEEPFTSNIGTSFTRWTTLGVSRGRSRAIDQIENEFVVNYSDGNDGGFTLRPPHPLDPLYISKVDLDVGRVAFLWFNYHNINKFYRVRRNPRDYFLDFWSTYLIHGRISKETFPTVGLRTKDMYSTESTFKDFQGINPNRSHALYDYTLDGNITPNPLYDGSASNLLRAMPALQDRHRGNSNEAFPEIVYKNSPNKGGAYYVSARYDQPDVMYYDTSIIDNDAAYEGYLRSEYYNGFYHHDMYGAHAEHLRPSTFIYACVKNAGLTPAFAQDGSDIPGDLNDHRMQLIANTDINYRDLATRILPALGYLLRMNGETRKIELVSLFTSTTPVFTFTDQMIQFVDVNYDSGTQYSSFTFENEDMINGDNTLDEFRESEDEQGRQVVFNSNVFVTGKPLEVKTGTWTSAYRTISSFLSSRQDRYQFVVSNCVLMEETGRLNIPAVGDWVRIDSELVPGLVKEVDVLLISKNVSEAITEYTGVTFQSG